MPILGKYRKPRPIGLRGYRVALMLALLLVVVVVVALRLGKRKEAPRPPTTHREPSASRAATAPPPDTPAPDSNWRALSPDEERAMLGRIVDQAPLGVLEHRKAYYYLLNKVHRMSDREMADRVDREIGYRDFAWQPQIVRGSVAEVQGILLRLQSVPLSNPKEAGLQLIYEGQIMDSDTPDHIYSFVLTERPGAQFKPDRVTIDDALRVRLRGIFMQNIVYQNQQNPPKRVATPLIIGRRLLKISRPSPETGPVSIIWPAALALAACLFGAWLFLLKGRRKRPHPLP